MHNISKNIWKISDLYGDIRILTEQHIRKSTKSVQYELRYVHRNFSLFYEKFEIFRKILNIRNLRKTEKFTEKFEIFGFSSSIQHTPGPLFKLEPSSFWRAEPGAEFENEKNRAEPKIEKFPVLVVIVFKKRFNS